MSVLMLFFMRLGPDFSHDRFLLEKIFLGAGETEC